MPGNTVLYLVLSFKNVKLITPFSKSIRKSKREKNAKSLPASFKILFKKLKNKK